MFKFSRKSVWFYLLELCKSVNLGSVYSAVVLKLWPQEQQGAVVSDAKSRQLCPTLCDPIDGSPPGSPVPEIFQARTLEWVAIAFSSHGWELIRNVHSHNSPQISESQSLCCVGRAPQLVWVEPESGVGGAGKVWVEHAGGVGGAPQCCGWSPAVGSH